ncbi:MAG: DUF4131 domain-containing protein, partial [Syntrophales bacterium]|nr:DUF4131 domain-containing protein [Syntrophales bacterium]
MKTPMAALCALLIAGITAGSLWAVPEMFAICLITASIAAFYIAFRAERHHIALATLALSWFLVGILAAQEFANPRIETERADLIALSENAPSRALTLEGFIVENPGITLGKARLTLALTALIEEEERSSIGGRILLTVRNSGEDYFY